MVYTIKLQVLKTKGHPDPSAYNGHCVLRLTESHANHEKVGDKRSKEDLAQNINYLLNHFIHLIYYPHV